MSYLGNPRLRLFVGATMISFSPVWVKLVSVSRRLDLLLETSSCFSPVWVKLVSVSPTTSGFYRVFIGGVALVLFLGLTRQRLQLTRRVWMILTGAAVFFALDLWFWHRSINVIDLVLSTLLANFQVFFMMLAGLLLLGQKPRAEQSCAGSLIRLR